MHLMTISFMTNPNVFCMFDIHCAEQCAQLHVKRCFQRRGWHAGFLARLLMRFYFYVLFFLW